MKLIDRDFLTNGLRGVAANGTAIAQGRRPAPPWLFLALCGAVALLALVLAIVLNGGNQAAGGYVTQPVVRQDLIQTVTASGTVNPQDTISVGTQDSGTINQIYVDFNSVVKKNQILARLDPQPFQAALDQANANLAQSQAQAQASAATAQGSVSNVAAAQAGAQASEAQVNVVRANAAASAASVQAANADVTKAQSALLLAQQTFNRDNGLLAQGYVTQSQVDTDRSSLIAAQSGVSSAQATAQQVRLQAAAALTQLQATIDTSHQQVALGAQAGDTANQTAAQHAASDAAIGIYAAQVQQAQLNLDRAVITSPVDGTVIARNISVGQTVAASFQTPTLFSIAKDLTKMQVDVAVGEPDIGNVKQRGVVDFTVLAFPTRTFHGVVAQVRQNPTISNNVVTYDTVVLVNNNDGVLRPGMTANASIHIATAPNALVVPIEALQYRPPGSAARRAKRGAAGAGGALGAASAGGAPGPAASGGATAGGPAQGSAWGAINGANARTTAAGSSAAIYVLQNGKPVRIAVTVLLISGAQAALAPTTAGALKAGDPVIVADGSKVSTAAAGGAARSPLAPAAGARPGGPGGTGGLR
jgi:HlyD family secretion protein